MDWDPGDDGDVEALCGDQHKRIALGVLVEEDRRLTVDDLTKAVVHHNHHLELRDAPHGALEGIKRDLERDHLPTLAEAGLAEFDRERGHVTPTERLEELAPAIEDVVDDDPKLDGPLGL